MVASGERKRLPRGVPEQTIMAALNAARQGGFEDLTVAELQARTRLAQTTFSDAMRRLAKVGKLETFKSLDRETGRSQLRIAIPE